MKPAVFLDRDGTINEDSPDLYETMEVKLLPGVLGGLLKLQNYGYKLVVISNQGGIEAGRFAEEQVVGFNLKLHHVLEEHGIRLAGIYFCPHDYSKNDCACHKPNTGMIVRAVEEHNLKLDRSWMVGDKTSDVMTGINAGCRTVLLRTGCAGSDNRYQVDAHHVADDLDEAADYITKR